MKRVNSFLFFLAVALFLFPSIPPAWGQKKEAREDSTRLSILSEKISVTGVALNYVEAGKGPPLLFLHGLGGSWKDWAANLPAFASTHQVIAIDLPGFGDSEKPEVEYSIEWLTDIVEKFLQDRKLDRVNLVGHSLGGLVALNLATRPNSRVKKLVVTDVVGIGDKAEFLSYALTKKVMGPETRWEFLEGALRDEFKSMIESFIKDRKPKTAREFFESLPKVPITGTPLLPMTPNVQLTASIIDFDIRPKLASIYQPTLILWGAKDPVAPPQDASLLQKGIRQSILIFFPTGGHSPMIEQPGPFNREVSNFLQASDSGSSK
jgi:pimeloyl-ACP methyl ester carboxylesterase